MLELYKKATAASLVLVVITSCLVYVYLENFFISDALLPVSKTVFPWHVETISDMKEGGLSTISVNGVAKDLDFNYLVSTKGSSDPFVTLVLAFTDLENPGQLRDLSKYSVASFKAKCEHRGVLSFALHTLDDRATLPGDLASYRMPTIFFSCENDWTNVEVDLRNMVMPLWWLETYGYEVSNQEYQLDQVIALSFVAFNRSAIDTQTNVKIRGFTFHGRDWRYMYILLALSVLIWSGFGFWLFRQYTKALVKDVQERVQKDWPRMSYQQLSLKPHKDKERSQILRFMAKEYPNPDLSLEMAVATLGVSRTKINEILKEEVGFTFSIYLNKLRLTEAARLLSENNEANVGEIAYSVGYNSVSYFNRLFKTEYGCNPKAFKSAYSKKAE